MGKLYPPEIGSTLPAFYSKIIKEKTADGAEIKTNKIVIRIPFIMNKTVAEFQIKGFNLRVKNISNSATDTFVNILNTKDSKSWNLKEGWVEFFINLDDKQFSQDWQNNLYIGSYYKMQLAYIDQDDTIGYYSSVGVAKYTTIPTVYIENLLEKENNINQNVYIGVYSQEDINGDPSEKVYSYRFDVYDLQNNLYATSGEQLHNSFEDVDGNFSRDQFVLRKGLLDNVIYKIKYTVTTKNNATFSSVFYRIVEKTTIDMDIKASLSANLNYDNGYVDIRLMGEKDVDGFEYPITGRFVLKRSSNKSDYQEWDTILEFQLTGKKPSRWLWRDFTVEHGYEYMYALQQYNDYNLYSNKQYSNIIYVAFEDIFLYNGSKQLKLKFNPKVTTFKNNVLETKTNTIGSKFPKTFRNGSVYYKEFPLNGLISYLSDEEDLFINKEDLFLYDETTNLTDKNLTSERLFKLKVLEFFNDGTPKLFRSPSEGNYIVKLINVSMSPADQLSRMLHSITGTAYEIADFNYQNLLKMGFITIDDVSDNEIVRWGTIPLEGKSGELLDSAHVPIYDFKLEDLTPGTIINIGYVDGSSASIIIGVSSFYEAHSDIGINSLISNGIINTNSVLTYPYTETKINTFDWIKDIELITYPNVQLFGYHSNILNEFNNNEQTLLEILYLDFVKREVYTIYQQTIDNEIIYSWDEAGHNLINNNEWNNYHVYKVIDANPQPQNNDLITYDKVLGYYSRDWSSLDGWKKIDNYSNIINIKYKNNNNIIPIDITETASYSLKALENLESIEIPIGVWVSGGVFLKKYKYNIKTNNSILGQQLINTQIQYQEKYDNYLDLLFFDGILSFDNKENPIYNEEDEKNLQYLTFIKDGLENIIDVEYKDKYFIDLNNAKNEYLDAQSDYNFQLNLYLQQQKIEEGIDE